MLLPAPAPSDALDRRGLFVLIAVHALAWALMQWLASGNLDGYHDMLENVAWAQTWAWGSFKHPPFFAWTVKLWFTVFPSGDLSYFLLSYVNVAVGLAGVAVMARELGLARFAGPAVLLLLWSLPYTTLASKFNANSQLLSLWPWTVAALLASVRRPGRAGWGWAVALGLLVAADLLAKYFSAVFLLGLLGALIAHPQGRRWLGSSALVVALVVFGLAIAPHIAWLVREDYPTIRYATEQGGGHVGWHYLWKFALSPLFYWAPGWLALVSVAARQRRGSAPGGWWRCAWRSWQPQGRHDLLFWCAMMPWAITMLCGLAELAELSVPWAIPIGFGYSLLWLRNLQADLPQLSLARLHRAAWPVLAVAGLLLTPALAAWRALHGDEAYYRPSEAAAQAVLADWQQRHPGLRLGWVGGEWAHNAVLPFYADPQIRALPGWPDGPEARIAPLPGWQQQAGLLLCPLGPLRGDPTRPDRVLASNACALQARSWLQARGRDTPARVLQAAKPASLRYPHPQVFAYAVFEVLPD